MFDVAAICLVATAMLAYVNHRFIGLPTSIGVMTMSMGLSVVLLALDAAGVAHSLHDSQEALLRSIDFSDVVMQGMLCLLLFAGALDVDITPLRRYGWQVGLLAIVGTTLSTFIVGYAMWWMLPLVGLPLPLIECLIFGALISPTDPIAVMGMLKTADAPLGLETVIAGESLFNDGVAVVLFALLLGMYHGGEAPSLGHGAALLLREGGGGVLLGGCLGGLIFVLLKGIDHYQLEVLMTLAAVMGGYALANRLHVSGPVAMVVVGLIIGNEARLLAMSETTRRYLDLFWELLDDILNAVLFLLIGMEAILITFPKGIASAAVAAIIVTLLARWLSVGLPVLAGRRLFRLPKGASPVLTWGGLRGGVSVALALSLPPGHHRETLITLTYCVVVWSILVQGVSMEHVMKRFLASER